MAISMTKENMRVLGIVNDGKKAFLRNESKNVPQQLRNSILTIVALRKKQVAQKFPKHV